MDFESYHTALFDQIAALNGIESLPYGKRNLGCSTEWVIGALIGNLIGLILGARKTGGLPQHMEV